MIIGLDVSTAIVGITALKQDGTHVRSVAVKLPSADLSERALFLEKRLHSFFDSIDFVFYFAEFFNVC